MNTTAAMGHVSALLSGGLLAVASAAPPGACPAPVHCCIPHETPGCNNACCCAIVCAQDPYCCDVEWDYICVCDGALVLCRTCGFYCECYPGACCLPDDTCVETHTFDCDAQHGDFHVLATCFQIACSIAEGDVNGDALVNVADLVEVILGWGPCPVPPTFCPDVNGDSTVDVLDLTVVILNWSQA